MIDGKNVFNQPVKNYRQKHDNIREIETGQWDDYITGCLLYYVYLQSYYKMMAIDLS